MSTVYHRDVDVTYFRTFVYKQHNSITLHPPINNDVVLDRGDYLCGTERVRSNYHDESMSPVLDTTGRKHRVGLCEKTG